jgi:hypothetical protein
MRKYAEKHFELEKAKQAAEESAAKSAEAERSTKMFVDRLM